MNGTGIIINFSDTLLVIGPPWRDPLLDELQAILRGGGHGSSAVQTQPMVDTATAKDPHGTWGQAGEGKLVNER